MSLTIRRAASGELSALVALEQAADRLFPVGRVVEGDTLSVAEHRTFMTEGLLLVASHEATLVGFVACKYTANGMHMYALAVHPEHMRKGFGTQLVRSVVANAQARSCKSISITTFEDICFNAPYYEKLGFRTLADDELSVMLKTILTAERSAGLTHRVAMVLDLE